MLGGWAIGEVCYKLICQTLPRGGRVLELGSGEGTTELCKHYAVTSIEDDSSWLGYAPSKYIHAPLENGWYSRRKLADLPDYDLLLVDGPVGELRRGMLSHMDLFNWSRPTIFDDAHRPEVRELISAAELRTGRQAQTLAERDKAVAILPGRKQRVYLTVPAGRGWLHKHVHFAILRMMIDGRYSVRHDCPTHSPTVNSLHKTMWDFLDGGEDYWITMDDDNPATRNPLDLIALNKDIIGLPTPVWHNAKPGDQPYYWNALKAATKEVGWRPNDNCDGLKEVDAVGGGCLVLSRKVCETMKDMQPFSREWLPDGTVHLGWDYRFCDRAKQLGFQIWTHYDYPCLHFNEIEVTEIIRAFAEMNRQKEMRDGRSSGTQSQDRPAGQRVC